MLPLQFGVPGGPELLVIFLIFVLLGLPVLLVLLVLLLLRRKRGGGASDDRVEQLERRVDELETELEEERRSQ